MLYILVIIFFSVRWFRLGPSKALTRRRKEIQIFDFVWRKPKQLMKQAITDMSIVTHSGQKQSHLH